MPCYTAPPSAQEESEKELNALLDEIGEATPRAHGSNIYGAMRSLGIQEMTHLLCKWCKAHDPTSKSLEFQIWWRDHQIEDARHERAAVIRERKQRARESALAKLSPDERKALGL